MVYIFLNPRKKYTFEKLISVVKVLSIVCPGFVIAYIMSALF